MIVTLPVDELIEATHGAKVGLLSNGTFWLEQVSDDGAGVVRRAARELVVLYGEHGPRGYEAAATPEDSHFDPYLQCATRSLYTYGKQLYRSTI